MAPALSIAICTHNRVDMVKQLIATLLPQTQAAGVRLIVVDSASLTPVATMLPEFAAVDLLDMIRLDQPGVSIARNAALEHARTPWLGFIDDDEIPAADWVQQALSLIGRLPSDCAACGGNVRPKWPGAVAPSPSRRWRDYLSIIDRAGEFDQSGAPSFGIGHSIVRTKALKSVGGFDFRLGRDGKSLLSGEESLLIDKLILAGWRIWHSDQMVVDHIISEERLERGWAIERAYWEGVSTIRRMSITAPNDVGRVARMVRLKALGLRPLVRLLGSFQDCDLRLAYAKGVLQENAGGITAAAGKPAAPLGALDGAVTNEPRAH